MLQNTISTERDIFSPHFEICESCLRPIHIEDEEPIQYIDGYICDDCIFGPAEEELRRDEKGNTT